MTFLMYYKLNFPLLFEFFTASIFSHNFSSLIFLKVVKVNKKKHVPLPEHKEYFYSKPVV